jgi:predicted peroxiredoxin
MVAGGVTPLIDAAAAREMGYKIVIWPCFAMTAAYLAYRQAAEELKTTGAIKERVGPDGKTVVGGIRDIFELCGLTKCAEFDREMGGKTFEKGV